MNDTDFKTLVLSTGVIDNDVAIETVRMLYDALGDPTMPVPEFTRSLREAKRIFGPTRSKEIRWTKS